MTDHEAITPEPVGMGGREGRHRQARCFFSSRRRC